MKIFKIILSALLLPGMALNDHATGLDLEWEEKDGKSYWREHGEVQGKEGDPKNVTDRIYGIERGREIYDPATKAWYWLDANNGGAKAVSKEVWIPYVYQDEVPGSTNGKWVRYDEEGKMIKGWYVDGQKVYYYDPLTGAMAKNQLDFDSILYRFDSLTGVLSSLEITKITSKQYSAALLAIKDNHMTCHAKGVERSFVSKTSNMYIGYMLANLGGITPYTLLEIEDMDWENPEETVVLVRGNNVVVYHLNGSFQTKVENCYYMEGGEPGHLYIGKQLDHFDDLKFFSMFALDYVVAE